MINLKGWRIKQTAILFKMCLLALTSIEHYYRIEFKANSRKRRPQRKRKKKRKIRKKNLQRRFPNKKPKKENFGRAL